MYKHLFLEGPVQSGKSTLLRKMLKPHMKNVGGFSSQRLLDRDGRTVAYRIGPAGTTSLTAPFSRRYDGIFRIITSHGNSLKFPEVFENEGVRYLKNNHGKKIILLDEIGGAEMLNYKFRETLYEVLAGDTPCIGVIKLEVKAKFMAATAGYDKSLRSYNRELRRMVKNRYNSRILQFRRNDISVEKEIEDFLCGIFTTD